MLGFRGNNNSLTKFSTSSLSACKQLGASDRKTLKTLKCLTKPNFYEFLNNHIFQKLTTDFENCTKRQAKTKACVVLDIDH